MKNDTISDNDYLEESNESTVARKVSPEMFVSGAEIITVCDLGYELMGNEVRTCSEEESWSSPSAFCELRNCSFENHPIFKFFKKLKENEIAFKNSTNEVSPEFDEKRNGTGNITSIYKNFKLFIEGNVYKQRIILTCLNNAQMDLHEIIANVTTSNITWTCNETAKWEVLNLSLKQHVFNEQLLNDSLHICDRLCASPQVSRT